MLNISALRQNYDASIKSTYNVIGREAVRLMEYSIKYGKPLKNYFGMNELLENILEKQDEIVSVSVFDDMGSTLYIVGKDDYEGTNIEDADRLILFEDNDEKESRSIEVDNQYHIFIPILNKEEAMEGGLEITLDNEKLNIGVEIFIGSNQKSAIGITILGCILMIGLIQIQKVLDTEDINRKKLLWILIIVLLVTQGLYTGYNMMSLNQVYKDISVKNAESIKGIVKENTDRLSEAGLGWTEFKGIELWLTSMTGSLPDVSDIILSNTQDESYRANNEAVIEDNPQYIVVDQLGDETQIGQIQVIISKENIRKKLMNAFLDSLSVLITSILIYVEISLLMVYALNRKLHKNLDKTTEIDESGMIRALAFLFIFGTDLSLSFIPIMSKEIYLSGTSTLSENIAVGLPLQAEMLATSIMALMTGIFIDKKGWKPPFMGGIIVVAIGSFLCSMASNLTFFALARGLVGIGYGLSWTSMTGYIGHFKSDKKRRRGFADLIAGIYAGSNCGVVIGAMLAERISFRPVFLVSIAFTLLAGILGYGFVKNTSETVEKEESYFSFKQFIKDPDVIKFFILISLPGMAILMFLNFFVPLYSKSINMTQSNLGRLFLIYGLSIIYLGPYLTDTLGKRMSSKQMLVSAAAIVGGAVILFALTGNVFTLILTIVLFSVADSYGITSKSAYYMELKASQKLGRGKAVGILSTVRKFGMMLGPNIFGLAFIYSISTVLFSVGATYVVLIIIFMLMSRKPKTQVTED